MTSEESLKIKGGYFRIYATLILSFFTGLILFYTDTDGTTIVISLLIVNAISITWASFISHSITISNSEIVIQNLFYKNKTVYKISDIKEMGVHSRNSIRINSKIYAFDNFSQDDLQQVVNACKKFRFRIITDLVLID